MAEKRIKIAGFQLRSGKSSYKEKASMPGPSPVPGRVPRPRPFPPVPPRGSTPRLYQGLVSKKEGEPRFKFLPKNKSVFPRGSRKTKVFGCLPLPPAQGTPGEALPKGSPLRAPPGGSFAVGTCPDALHKPCCCLLCGHSWEKKAGFQSKSPGGGLPAQGWCTPKFPPPSQAGGSSVPKPEVPAGIWGRESPL